MRKYAVLLSSLAAMAMALIGAGSASAGACDVLTSGSLCNSGGTNNVGVGDILTARLDPLTSASFSSGFVSFTCSGTAISAKVGANPAEPGVATTTLTSLTFTGCTSNLGSLTIVTLDDGSASASSSNEVAIEGQEIEFTIGSTTCVYEASSSATDTGTWSNAKSLMTFTRIPLQSLIGGSFCSSTGALSLTLGPVADENTGLYVYVNPT